jgi:hypothetical protein
MVADQGAARDLTAVSTPLPGLPGAAGRGLRGGQIVRGDPAAGNRRAIALSGNLTKPGPVEGAPART